MRRPSQALLACLALLPAAACADPEDRVREALLAHLSEENPELTLGGEDFLLLTENDAVVECRALQYGAGTYPKEERRLYHLHRTRDGWSVRSNLVKDFQDRARKPAFMNRVGARMKKNLEEKYDQELTFKSSLPNRITVTRQKDRVVGEVQIAMRLHLSKSRYRTVTYMERHHFEPDGWVFDTHSILEKVAR